MVKILFDGLSLVQVFIFRMKYYQQLGFYGQKIMQNARIGACMYEQ